MTETQEESAINKALTWYIVNHHERCRDINEDLLKEISKEIGEITLRMPLHHIGYKKGEIKGTLKSMNLKLITVNQDNLFEVKEVGYNFTPLQLMALYYYLADKLTGGQMSTQPGFDCLKDAKKIIERGKPICKST